MFPVYAALLMVSWSQAAEEPLPLRLVDGDTPCSGRVEVLYNGTWGTVCDDYWDMPDVVVVCRQLSCGFAQSARGTAQFGEGTEEIWLDDVKCLGTESHLQQCNIRPPGEHNCNHVEDAGVICNAEQAPQAAIYHGRRGSTFVEGEDLRLKCSTQGYYSASMFYLYKDGGLNAVQTQSPNTRDFAITFTISNISSTDQGNYTCSYETEITGKVYRSAPSESLEVVLKDQLQPPSLLFSRHSAVFLKGQNVALRCEAPEVFEHCRYFLFREGVSDPLQVGGASAADSGPADYALFNLTDLSKDDEGSYTCRYQVLTSGRAWINSSLSARVNITIHDDVKLRLSEKEGDCVGTLEVRYNGTWALACGDTWNLAASQVTCRHLGCGFARSFRRGERSAAVRDRAQLNHAHCLGTEQLLWRCQSLSWADGACYSGYRVAITCSERPLQPTIHLFRSPSVFMASENVTVLCRLPPFSPGKMAFLYRSGQEVPVLSAPVPRAQGEVNFTLARVSSGQSGEYACAYDMDVSELVFTSELSEHQTITVKDEPPEPVLQAESTHYLPGQILHLSCQAPRYFSVLTYYLSRDSGQRVVGVYPVSVQDAPAQFAIRVEGARDGGDYTCSYEMKASGRLYNSSRSEPVSVTVTADIKLRVSDGPDPCSGRVEGYANGTWGTVCDIDWDLPDAEVVCRQLRCGFALSATRSGYFGPGTGKAWGSHVACNGTEAYLWVCPFVTGKPNSCLMNNDAGVICSDQPFQPNIELLRTSGVYAQGENVTVHCSAPAFYLGASFYLYRAGEKAHVRARRADPDANAVTFELTRVDLSDEGHYTCAYQMERDGRNHTSFLSSATRVAIIDRPPKPGIALLRGSGEFSVGETARVRCEAPEAYSGVIFVLSRVQSQGPPTTVSTATVAGFSTILALRDVSSKDQGEYVCSYQIKRSGRLYNSTLSDRVRLRVTDRLQKPALSQLRPSGQYLEGQSAIFACDAPSIYRELTFTLHRPGEGPEVVTSLGPTANASATLTVTSLRARDQGPYTCRYRAMVWGREYASDPSDPVNVTLTRQPEGAKLTVSTLFGLYVQGKAVRISCLAPEYYSVRRFSLEKDGREAAIPWLSNQWTPNAAEFRITNTTVSDSGNYSCRYETEVGGALVNSSHSNFVKINVAERVEIRLVNGSNSCSGRVEILNNGTWGTVCDDQWQVPDAQVVCRELQCGAALFAMTHAYFGKGAGPIALDDLECQGTEVYLWQCPSRHWGQHNCHHEEDAGVVCSGPKPRLSLLPDFEAYLPGESVSLSCSLPSHNASKRLEFLRDGAYLSEHELGPQELSASHRLGNLRSGDQGDYTCLYLYRVGEEWVRSTPSETVRVTVTDKLSSHRRRPTDPSKRKGMIGFSVGILGILAMGLLTANQYLKSGYIWNREGRAPPNLQPLMSDQEEPDRDPDEDVDI